MKKEGIFRQKQIKTVLVIFLFVFVSGIVFTMIAFLSNNHGAFKVYRMDKEWDISFHGRTYINASLNDHRFCGLQSKKNDVIVMKKTIDIDTGGFVRDRITLRVYSRLSSLRVSIIDRDGNEKQIYFYGYEHGQFKPGEFLGSGYHFIQLPQNCEGRTLCIAEMASEDGAIAGLPGVIATKSNHMMEAFAQERIIGTFITVFMFIAGSMITIMALAMALVDREFMDLALLGLFSASGGLWCMCSMKSVELFSQDIQNDSLIEYISLYVFVIPLMGLAVRFFKKVSLGLRIAMFVSMCLNTALAIGAWILQATGLANVDTCLSFFHLLLAFDALSLTSIAVFRWRKSDLAEKFFEGGILAAAFFGVVYILYYYLNDETSIEPGIFDTLIMPAAFLFMVVLILIGYMIRIYARRVDGTQRQQLESLAFEDDLTGLSNRNRGELMLRELDSSDNDYVIINFDLNFLKRTNDEFGHTGGDLYLKTFSMILKKLYPDADCICRMGGDEFMVAYEHQTPERKTLREKAQNLMRMEDAATKALPVDIMIDASYGWAFSHELEGKPAEDVYRLADQRMYEMKVRTKKGRGF